MKCKVLGFILAVIASLMLCGTIDSFADVKDVNGAPVYVASDPGNLLGIAADFGIFADKVDMTAHVASTVACNSLKYGNMHPTTNGVIYARKYVAGNAIGCSDAYSSFLPEVKKLQVYVGSQYKISSTNQGQRWTLNDGKTSLDIDCGCPAVFYNESASTPFINIESELEGLKNTAVALKALPDSGASFQNLLQGNDKRINCTEDVNVLNLSYNDFTGNPLHIYGIKGTDRQLTVNVTGIERLNKVSLPQIFFENDSAETGARYAAQVIWNFGDFDGEVSLDGEFGGTILAPAATVRMNSNLIGLVIAKTFLNYGGEVHFIPSKYKKSSEVQVSIESVDGTCCPSVPIKGVKAVLYKKTEGKKYKKYGSDAVKTTGEDSVATWTIKEEGDYYIRESKVVDGFAQTPVKCFFTVKKDENGVLRIYGKKNPKEGNGENTTFKANSDNTAASFKLRHYSDSLYLAAYIAGEGNDFELVSFDYTFAVTNLITGQSVDVVKASGVVDEFGTEYNMNEAHIKESGRYQVTISADGAVLETKVVDVYLLPVGAYTFVEREFGELADAYEALLGTGYNVTKINTATQQKILTMSAEEGFDMMTDGCVFFDVAAE